MSKADTLGPAPAFSTVRSARRNAINKIGAQGAAEAVTELPVTVVSENPDNPRNHLRNLDETVESVREVGIILPIVVATVEAYLHDRPDRANDLDDRAQYVVVDGHRRLEASRRVGLATIPVRVDNARVATDEALLEAAFVANYHRDDMTDLEEATALQSLVDFYGSQTKASKRLGIPQSVISSKLSLLKLAPDLQADLVSGKRTVEHVRNLGKLSPEEQRRKADERAAAAEARRAAQPEPKPVAEPPERPQATAGTADYHGVIIPGGSGASSVNSASGASHGTETVDRGQGSATGVQPKADRIPDPREATATEDKALPEGRKLPYDDGTTIGQHLTVKMDSGPFIDAVRVMVDRAWGKAGAGPSLDLLQGMLRAGAEHAPDDLRPMLLEALEALPDDAVSP